MKESCGPSGVHLEGGLEEEPLRSSLLGGILLRCRDPWPESKLVQPLEAWTVALNGS